MRGCPPIWSKMLTRSILFGSKGVAAVGITAGASAPEELVKELLDGLGTLFNINVETMDGVTENAYFQLPPELNAAPLPASRSS